MMSKKDEKGENMQACKITIATTADGKKTETVRDGKMALTMQSARLTYAEENAKVALIFENGSVVIERNGDYTMRLRMQKDEICDGTLGIGGAEGAIQTKTTRLAYVLTEKSFMLSLHYDLLIGEETQKMRIRLFARYV